MLHEASLIHDDLVDKSDLRRGAPALQMSHGEGLSLLIGDYLIFQGLKLVLDAAENREDIVLARELASTGLSIAQGEVEQLERFIQKTDWEERIGMEHYLDIIAKKTAMFFCRMRRSRCSTRWCKYCDAENLPEMGLNLGMVFQLMDDMLDVTGDPAIAQKSLQNNLSEGTVTLPLIHAWQLYPEDRALLKIARYETLDAEHNIRCIRCFAARLCCSHVKAPSINMFTVPSKHSRIFRSTFIPWDCPIYLITSGRAHGQDNFLP